ncbi:MAG: polysaccharide polymerase [Flavobacteriaceae bacterium]|uniref:O-antigen polysaccharide polymerase Wzy n=1 Tax=Winogradskyella sp. SYSU M77433 TaxID=3042722 RepID=UPI000C6985ED|nr:O-antigen polysaccharide polymerase Wzy [Winogradskyella sp. SYSU M77433]MAX70206.1 polysaccharide polymerase [Flavobacteriaceae bacterium]MDH7913708.1 O-antigen polysaccharide polymerase Wzy [Winogradskyella sp. SYSU M77433]|tara:strand:+ start:3341 stop:4750 length:1410 start_codon:yes stop_codon:yes gene_type:complete
MNLRKVFLLIYILLSTILFASFSCDIFVWASFFISFLVISLIAYYHLFIEKEYSPFISAYIVFNYLFFLLAPIIQIGSFTDTNNRFATMFVYNIGLTLKTNAIIVFFNIIFFFSYVYFKKKFKSKITRVVVSKKDKTLPLTLLILLIISLTVLFFSLDFIMDEFARPSWKKSTYSVFELLVQKKVLFMIPFATIILCSQFYKSQNKKNNNAIIIFFILIFSIIILFWFKNPLTEKRNALGPIYIGLIFIFFPKILNTNVKIMSFLFFAMILLFPLFQIFTHIDYSFEAIVNNPKLILEEFTNTKFAETFNTLNYDAYSNISATIEYVSMNGFSYGYQLLSGLLFFVPRSIWESKPISTGELIGDFIIDEYGFNFNNLSNPLVSEGYVNFGIFGVILLSLVLSFIVVRFLIWLNSRDQLKKNIAFYFSIHMLFLLRGDFTNGYAYFIGTILGVLLIPKFVNKAVKLMLKK